MEVIRKPFLYRGRSETSESSPCYSGFGPLRRETLTGPLSLAGVHPAVICTTLDTDIPWLHVSQGTVRQFKSNVAVDDKSIVETAESTQREELSASYEYQLSAPMTYLKVLCIGLTWPGHIST